MPLTKNSLTLIVLSLLAGCASPPPVVYKTTSTPAPTVNQQAAAQPDRAADQPSDAERETLRLIAQIAADGDKAINQLNACVDAYEAVRSQINGNNR